MIRALFMTVSLLAASTAVAQDPTLPQCAADARPVQGINDEMPVIDPSGPQDYVIIGTPAEWPQLWVLELVIGDQTFPITLESGGEYIARGIELAPQPEQFGAYVSVQEGLEPFFTLVPVCVDVLTVF
jgi:hypothetical protein